MIVPKALSFDPKLVKNKIGEGTSSTVTMGTYSREYVAVKQVWNMDKMSASEVRAVIKEALVMQVSRSTRTFCRWKACLLRRGCW
jgi:hypothetical protein